MIWPSGVESRWRASMNPEHSTDRSNERYHCERARQERKLASSATSPAARNLHLEMAEQHEHLAARLQSQ